MQERNAFPLDYTSQTGGRLNTKQEVTWPAEAGKLRGIVYPNDFRLSKDLLSEEQSRRMDGIQNPYAGKQADEKRRGQIIA